MSARLLPSLLWLLLALPAGAEPPADAGVRDASPAPATTSSPTDGGTAPVEPRREGDEWVLPSGLRYVELRVGKGALPHAGAKITVHYTGRFQSGKVFDTSRGKKPWSFVWGANQVIRGYEEGMATMRVGGRRKLVVPPSLAYGEKGFKTIIPPNATLIFDVQLLSVR